MNAAEQQPLMRRRAACRSAMTLMEVMVAVTVSGLLMGTVITLMIALKQADRKIRQADLQSRQLIELAETLREDIRRSVEVSRPAETLLLLTSPDERQTRYELTASGCRRSFMDADEEKPRLEIFAVGPAASWTLSEAKRGRRPLFVVTLNRVDSRQDMGPRSLPFVACAALGADLPIPPHMLPAE